MLSNNSSLEDVVLEVCRRWDGDVGDYGWPSKVMEDTVSFSLERWSLVLEVKRIEETSVNEK